MKALVKFLIVVSVALGLMNACGIEKSLSNSESTVQSVQKTATDAADLKDGNDKVIVGPTFLSGPCDNHVGCVNGFISHGLRIKIAPEKRVLTAGFKNFEGQVVALHSYTFRDAQDFGDSFTKAFVEPLADPNRLESMHFRVVPPVERDNFAAGFELYAEGLNASDGTVKMTGQGNFSLGGIDPYDKVFLRAIKMFRIEATIEEEDGSQTKKVVCLEISYTEGPLNVAAGEPTKIGGLAKFFFYYTRSKDLCSDERLSIVNDPFGGEERLLEPIFPDFY